MKFPSATRLILFALLAALSLWISFVATDRSTLFRLVIFLSYPSVLAAFTVYCLGLIRLHRCKYSLRNLLPRTRCAWFGSASAENSGSAERGAAGCYRFS